MSKKKPDLIKSVQIPPQTIQRYERYLPTAFDESLSILEKINKVINHMNEIGELTLEMLTKWNEVYEWIMNEGLEEAIGDRLEEWLDDGTFEDILERLLLHEYAKITWVEGEITSLRDYIDSIEGDLDDVVNNFINDVNDILDKVDKKIEGSKTKSQGAIYQKKQMEAYFGFGGNEIFSGGQRANQGMAYIKHDGKEKIFMVSKVQGSSWSSQERQRITEFEFKTDGSSVRHTAYSEILSLSHQGISAYLEDGEIILITGANTGDGINQAKGYSKVRWMGDQTTQTHVTAYQVFGNNNSSHRFEMFNHATPAVSPDGKYIALATASTFDGGVRYMTVYDRLHVEQQGNPLNAKPLNSFKITQSPYHWGNVVQDVATDGSYIYIASGHGNPKNPNQLVTHEMNGAFVGYTRIDGAVGDYTDAELESHPSLGKATQLEPEGLSIRGNNLLYQTTDVWKDSSGNYTKRGKVIHEITTEREGANPINRGFGHHEPSSSLHVAGGAHDITFPRGTALQISDWDSETGEMLNALTYNSKHSFGIHDTRNNTNQSQKTVLSPYFDSEGAGQYVIFRSDRSNGNGAGFNAHTKDSTSPGRFSIHFGQGTPEGEHRIYFYVSAYGNGKVSPREDGKIDLGSASTRFQNLYVTGGALETSDRNDKQDILPIDDAVMDAWEEVEYSQFKMRDAVAKKGNEKARTHIGIIAQDIVDVFKTHNLNAFDYGIVGYDSWDAESEIIEEGEIVKEEIQSGEKYSIRSNECMMLESALLRRKLNELKANK